MTGCVEKMKDKFLRFMYGRYGVDQFSKCLVVLGILFLLLSGFTRNGGIFYLLSLAILVYSYFRMFSRNHSKRYAENQLYLKYTAGIRKNDFCHPLRFQPAKALSYLQVPVLRSEDPYSTWEGKD